MCFPFKIRCIFFVTNDGGVRDGSVVEKPDGLDAVHPSAFDADRHSALLTHDHSWREEDARHSEGLLLLCRTERQTNDERQKCCYC